MSDLRHGEQPAVTPPAGASIHRNPGSFDVRGGLRMDPPHPFGTPTVGSADESLPDTPESSAELPASFQPEFQSEYDVVEEPHPSTPTTAAAYQTQFPYGDPLLQARQIAEHLQKRYSELQRREQRLNAQLSQLDQERRTVRMWVSECESVIQQRDDELVQRESNLESREAECLKQEHELQSRKAAVLLQEKELSDIQAQWRAEWEQERATLQQELDQKRIEIQNEEIRFAQVKETQVAEIQQERTLLMNRIRFQEEHLQKLRKDFEATQSAFHVEKQRIQSFLAETEHQQRRREANLARYRSLLEERDAGVQRQHILLAKTRKAGLDSLTRDHQRIVADQRDWQMVRERQQAELVRQTEMLRLNAENLEARQKRLESLRAELEETNRRTLEMRLVVEEACAQLAQAVGPEAARQRIEAAQRSLSDHYRQAREQLLAERREVEQFQQVLVTQRDQLRAEQQALSDWMTKQDEQLRSRDAKLRQEEASSTTRELAWQNTREGWLLEKLEAESIIRDLLKRLEAQSGPETVT